MDGNGTPVDLFFDRSGQPISAQEASRLLADIGARRVALTVIGELEVSTVFIPLALPSLDGVYDDDLPPVLWETMVFGPGGSEDLVLQRYRSEDDALDGHNALVESLRVRPDVMTAILAAMADDEPPSL